MTRHARLVRPDEGREFAAIAVPVLVDGDGAFVSEAVVAALPDAGLVATLSSEWCRAHGLTESAGTAVVLRRLAGPVVVLAVVGATLNDPESYRCAAAAAVAAAGEVDVAFFLPTDGVEHPDEVAQALVEGALLASYRYLGDSETTFAVVPVGAPLPTVDAHDAVDRGLERASIVADAVNWAKQLINTPANAMTPRDLARAVVERLDLSHVTTRVWNEDVVVAERCGGVVGVGQGSVNPVRLVFASYDPEPDTALPHVALVGKGVTFDSGGLSLKPAADMHLMKTDMTGAAVVMATVAAVASLGLRVRVTAIAPMAENVVGENSIKPGDVVTIRNGLTVEVLNTDAEGRLLLADGLSLAVEAEPDAIIDIATLTGAQRVALGNDVGAMYATTDELARYVSSASARSGEPFWRMPLIASYRSQLESYVADLANIGKAGQAGSVVAALFLERFTAGVPWVHLDVVGPARAEATKGYTSKGATAFGARTLIHLLEAVADESSR
ncbi:MAG: leucyl aminopeptidase family protein [Acidimicrobiales bacterium]